MKSSRKRPEFYMVLGDGWKSVGKPQEAAAAYRRACRSSPIRRGRCALWRRWTRRTPNRFSRGRFKSRRTIAESWFRYGVLTSSAERIQKAIALDPWLPDQSRRLAEITHSEAALNDALRTDPFDDAAWDLGGRILAEKGKFADAFFDFERAIKLRP